MGQGAVTKVCVGKVSPTMSIGKCYCVVGTRDDQLAQCGSIAQWEYQTLHSILYDFYRLLFRPRYVFNGRW